MEPAVDLRKLKAEIRTQAQDNRQRQADKDESSGAVWERFVALPEYVAARTVMLYVHLGDEVRTQPFLPRVLAEGKRVVVPYCVDNSLELFRLESMDELEIGTWGILEPRLILRAAVGKRVAAGDLDMVMVPGVAFDRRGARMGYGKGYYDRLLQHVRPETRLVGAAYECQMFPEIPMSDRDVFMDRVITEQAVYAGQGREPSARRGSGD